MNLEYQNVEVRPGLIVSQVRLHPSGAGFVREREAAAYIGISLRTLQRMREKSEGFEDCDIKKIKGSIWYRLNALLEYVEEHCAVRAA